MSRTGVFGGTFDPPHLGHLIVAQDVLEAMDFDRLLLVPAGVPPHTPEAAPAPGELRARMLEAAVADHGRIEVSRIELERSGPSYTVDTLTAMRASAPEDELFLVIGSDQLRTLATWRAPLEVARLAKLVVMSRGGTFPDESQNDLNVPFRSVAVTRVDVSSSEVRRRIALGRSVRWWVPNGVLEIIREEKLYGTR
jgi:nicotinate-nucleotide adenylyltransferase